MGETDCRVGLVGAGIDASLSPALHEREAAALGIDYAYELLDIDDLGVVPEAVGELVGRARRSGFRGLNVTHPCKQLVLGCLDELSSHATTLGAVNTVVFEGERALGYNTDWPGFAESFARGLPDARTDEVVLVGAGGAGSAVAHALGAGRLTIVDEDADRARELADGLAGARTAPPAELGDLLATADGLVHATPTGMAAHPGSAVDAELLRPELWVAEVVYRPLQTQLLRDARARGCRTLDGGGMAVFQAAGSLELFAGVRPDRERMLRHFAELEEVERCAAPSPPSR
jgi:quinate/shikimate dehydrogenase (NAD+)